MKFNKLYPSKYLAKDDLAIDGTNPVRYREVPVVISKFTVESVGQGEDAQVRPIMHFEGKKKGMAMNPTNGAVLQAGFGVDDTDDLIGKQIILWVDPTVQFKGKVMGGLRVKVPATQPDMDEFADGPALDEGEWHEPGEGDDF